MGKFNDRYLRPALDSLEGSAESLLGSANSVTNRINAESDAVRDKSRAERTFRENLSIGVKALLILLGIGILSLLLAWAASIIIKALKDETTALEKLEVIEDQVMKSDENLKELSNIFDGEKIVTSSDLETYFDNHSKVLNELTNLTSNLSSDLEKIKQELSSASQKSAQQENATSPNYSGYRLQTFTKNETSSRCYENASYTAACKDTVEFSNGWLYAGTWVNGQPQGEGTLTFPGGAKIEATWKEGVPVEVKKSGEEEQKILKSITYFQNFSARHINSSFRNAVIGYKFDSGTDETWKSAYCYLEIKRGNEDLTIDLSRYNSFSGSKKNQPYTYSTLISSSEFKRAQDLCKYKRSGFN